MNKLRKYGNVIKTINVCTRPNKGRNCEREKMLEERMRLNDTFFMFYWQDSSASQSHCHSSSTTTGKHDDFMHFGCDGGWSCLYISKMPEITKYCKVILAFPPRKTVPMLKFLLYSTLKIVVFASKCYSKMHNIFNINRTMMYRFWMWVSECLRANNKIFERYESTSTMQRRNSVEENHSSGKYIRCY